MRVATLVLALALATNAVGVLAAPTGDSMHDGSMTATSARDWSQAGTFEQQSEAAKANLDRAGFPQYTN